MRIAAAGIGLAFALIAGANVALCQPPAAATSYCPNRAHARPAKVGADLVAAVAKTFQIDEGAARDAFVRCVGATLMACSVGANLDCGKADARRALPGATAWCRQNPGSTMIPMYATGHATIYAWSCHGNRAIAGKTVLAVDRQGYIAANWKEIQ